jgi:hypothetical protein
MGAAIAKLTNQTNANIKNILFEFLCRAYLIGCVTAINLKNIEYNKIISNIFLKLLMSK